ncbi:OmpA family protein [Nisaea sediminum]|uniref:OmpA family protein n=1 Tax=Nisaea sediminum TaxID=2775867 RepID=UPI00186638A7|nr:OmpA family protein [Nisaea sediminum]
MKKYLLSTVPMAFLAFVPANADANIFFEQVEEIRKEVPAGDDFRANLVREYKDLTIFEADEMYDWIDAENHAEKGMMAAKGQTPMPSDPKEWSIEDPLKLRELEMARAGMIALFDKGARTTAPKQAAHAQAKYDCWVEQQEEGHQPAHIAACKQEFDAAMAALELAMQPKVSEAKPAPKTTTVTTVVEEIARETVYFGFDSSSIRPAEQAKIDAFVTEMKGIQPVVTLYIEGHADTSGPADYNMKLSADRAQSVRTELGRQGMTLGDYEKLEVEPEGESKPAVELGDGVREQLNRRVVIIARGQVTKTDSVAVAPQ